MPKRGHWSLPRLAGLGVVLLLFASASCPRVQAQQPPAPPSAPGPGQTLDRPPPLPGSSTAPAPAPSSREAELEARVRQLEAMVRELSAKVDRVAVPPPATTGSGAATPSTSSNPPSGVASAEGNRGNVPGGSGSPRGPSAPAPRPRFEMPAPVPNFPIKGKFGPGFAWSSEDDEYQFQFHDLTQIDYRGIWDTPHAPLTTGDQSTFGVPRQWWIFSGRIKKPFEYMLVPSFAFNSLNLLEGFLNIHFDDRLQFKIGRYKTPFTYEFYNEPIGFMMNPERSLFFNNFGLNRDVGMMAWGQMFEKRIDYAVGIFNGTRNNYVDVNSAKDIAAYINFRPFGKWEGSILENFNIGGSVDAGNQLNKPVPQTLRTNVATTGSSFYGVPFLAFNNNVIESGDRAFWDLHAAWYVNSLSLIAEWASGFQDYAKLATPFYRTHLPVNSYYVQAGYFLTGERVAARGQVKPLHDFDIRKGKLGLGAIELTARYSYLSVGPQVFTAGLSDPSLWSRSNDLIDVGFNWYWTSSIKLYLGWQHAGFGAPVLIEPGRYQLTNDMLWARFQIYF